MRTVCDCFPDLKENLLSRQASYSANPDKPAPEGPNFSLEVKIVSIGDLDELVECEKSGHKFIISEPTFVGGRNIAPWPLEYLLAGAVGCFAAVFAFYAAKLAVSYDSFEATARTYFDARGHMMPDAPFSGFQRVELAIRVVSDEPEYRLKEVEQLALKGCPGLNTLRQPVPVSSVLTIAKPRSPMDRGSTVASGSVPR